MSSAAPAHFWAIAILGSIALHGAVGMGLYAMPMPEPKKPAHTEITISAPEIGTQLQQAEPETVAARPTDKAAAVAEPPLPRLAASDPTEFAEQHDPTAIEATVATNATEAKPAQPPELAPSNGVSDMVEAAADSEIVVSPPQSLVLAEVASESESAQTPGNPIAPVAGEPDSVVAGVAEAAEPVTSTDDLAEQPTPITDAKAPAVSASEPDIVVAGLSKTADPVVSSNNNVAVKPRPIADPSRTEVAPSGSVATAIVSAELPSGNPSGASAPVRPTALAPASSGKAVPATAAAPQPIGGTEVAAISALPEAATTEPAADEPVVAMIRPENVAPDDDLAVPDSSGMRIEEFLSESEGSDCLLALPLDPMQASVEAYAATPEAVHALGAEYMRVAGLDLKTEMRPVSKAQCGALGFARSLAQYPNFPLQLALNQPTIASGADLSGSVSGLRKDTLYLMIVDDEGKAKLVSTSNVGDVPSLQFSAPMTLTSGPGSAVQLLIAIAADGPLRTLPTKLGEPASEYFSKLTFEIIGDNRSIAYGITSFAVR